MCTPIASITPYQVALVIHLPNFDLSRKSHVNSVVEQVDNQGEGDEQERREDVEQVDRVWKTLLHGSYGRVRRHKGNAIDHFISTKMCSIPHHTWVPFITKGRHQ